MEILATMREGRIVVLDGFHRLHFMLKTKGSAPLNVDGKSVVVELNEVQELVIKPE